MTRRYALRDDQWERIEDLLPGRAFPLLSHCRRTIGCSWKLNKPFARVKVMQRYQISTHIASFGCLCWRLVGDVVGCGVGCAIACKSWTQ